MKKLFLLGAALAAAPAMFAGEVTLPNIGVDVSDYVTAGITALGAVVAVAVGGYAAFLIVRKALKWIGKALS